MKQVSPMKEDEALRSEIMALIKRHLTPDTGVRVLAIASQVVGQALALQDQRTISKSQALEVVMANIEHGNLSVIATLMDSKGNA